MKKQLIKGHFQREEALQILREIVAIKMKFHETKITQSSSEEEIKMRENRIRQLQQDWEEMKSEIQGSRAMTSIQASIHIGEA